MYFSTALIFLIILLDIIAYYLQKQQDDENNGELKNSSMASSSSDQQSIPEKDQSGHLSLDEIKVGTHNFTFPSVDLEKYNGEKENPSPSSSLNQQTLHQEVRSETKDLSSSSSPDKQCRRFSLDEIKSATHDFDDAFVIGKGGFGKVYKGKIDFGEEIDVAIKRSNLDSNQGASEFWAEIEMLSKFRHSHIVSLLGYCEESAKREMILVYEYMPNGSLDDHLHKKRAKGSNSSSLTWVQRLHICIGAARGLDYLHTGTGVQCRVIHRDVKSSNIFLDENLVAKVSDFGISRTGPAYQSGATTDVYTGQIIGTFGYIDAEYFSTHRLTRKSDVYAFGVVLFEVLCGRPALDLRLDEQQHSLAGWAKHCIKEGRIDRIIDPCLKEQVKSKCLKEFGKIAYECVLTCSKDRPTMTKVLARLEFVLAWTLRSGQRAIDQKHITRSLLVEKTRSLFSMKPRKNMFRMEDGWTNLETLGNLPCFGLNKIAKATNNFNNKIGEGGFGAVYMGVLEDGKVVAVKRLTYTSYQGYDEFKNEVICTAKLQHSNLVKLLGYCVHGDEMILIQEYMANKSLDTFLFDETRSSMLDWPKRFHIILGIARGILYLHQNPTLQIIHRDLKPSNILLDDDMVPKISDFGIARMFVGSGSPTVTSMVEGTLCYLSPEYMLNGLFSIKSDVFSFGLMVLEIVSGKQNRKIFSQEDDTVNLREHAWRLFKENRSTELMSASLRDSFIISEVIRVVHVAFLCVQYKAEDRPTMSEVVEMLLSDDVLSQPKQPFTSAAAAAGGETEWERMCVSSDEEYMITQVYTR